MCFRVHHSLEQLCEKNVDLIENTNFNYSGDIKTKQCFINNVYLINEGMTITTPSNDSILSVCYGRLNTISFIPNSLFQSFPNMSHFCILGNQGFRTIKAEFFKHASKLESIYIPFNSITELNANIFKEAPGLDTINLEQNLISTINVQAFEGLSKLRCIFLQKNRIKNLHPLSFTSLISLRELNLLENFCINITLDEKHTVLNDELIKTLKISPCDDESALKKSIQNETKAIYSEEISNQNKNFEDLEKKFKILKTNTDLIQENLLNYDYQLLLIINDTLGLKNAYPQMDDNKMHTKKDKIAEDTLLRRIEKELKDKISNQMIALGVLAFILIIVGVMNLFVIIKHTCYQETQESMESTPTMTKFDRDSANLDDMMSKF